MNERLALLSAILANPDDDLPRLVFADWLEENGTSDADAARVEFIRLGCKGKAKSGISVVEGKWLDSNWKRLMVNSLNRLPVHAEIARVNRKGRIVQVTFRWDEGSAHYLPHLSIEYVRGFARQVCFRQGYAYNRFSEAVASDEPLAYHRPEQRPAVEGDPMTGFRSRLLPTTWGANVFARVQGWGPHSNDTEKFFYPATDASRTTRGRVNASYLA